MEVEMVRYDYFLRSLIIVCAPFTIPQEPTAPRQEPDVVAINFKWARESTSLIRGAQNPGGPITTPMPAEDRDLGSRKVELRNVDKQATIFQLISMGTLIIFSWSLRTPARMSSGA